MIDRRGSGLGAIAIATAIAGLGGYVITTVSARGLDASEYSQFAIFWGALFLSVGALAGIQQEFARASALTEAPDRAAASRGTARRLAPLISLAAVVAVLVVVVPILALLFPADGVGYGAALLVGTALSTTIAMLSGIAYGTRSWSILVVVIIADVLLRLVFIGIALLADAGPVVAGWAAVAPYPLVLAFLVMRIRRVPFSLDVGGRALVRHLVSTVGASIGMAALVSGAPLLIGVAAGAQASEVGPLVYALTLTRAPLVVGVLALQSYLVVWFRGRTDLRWMLARTVGVLVAGGVVFAVAVWLWGVPVIVLLAGEDYAIDPALAGWLVAASLSTAVLGITGAAALAMRQHALYVAGWSVAAVVVVATMLWLPAPLSERVVLGLAVGPLIGVGIHLAALRRRETHHAAS